MQISISHFDIRHDLYQECLKIRLEVLRKPLGLEILDTDREKDAKSTHILCRVDGEPAGTVALMGNTLRQMAVLDKFQGKDIGRKLVAHLEQVAKSQGYNEVELSSRVVAIRFYEKCGYHAYGEVYEDIKILHQAMSKII